MTTSDTDSFSAALNAHQSGDLATAVSLYRSILGKKPDFIQAWLNLGLALRSRNEGLEAVACFEAAVRLNPRFPGAHLALGAVLRDLGRLDEAAECCRKEIKLNPLNADAHYNLGLIRQNQDRLREAADAYQKTLKLNPQYADALVNFGCLRQQQDQPGDAIDFFEKALRAQPSLPRAHWALARALLLTGDYTRGFEEHEWRWKMNDFTTPAWSFPQPLWQGESLAGRSILLHAEQGAGDTLQFIRYVPMVAKRGGRIIVGCPADLADLLKTIPGVAETVTSRERLPSFDTHAPVMSLPKIFGATLASIPAQTPYLRPPADRQCPLPCPLAGKRALRLGLVWAGGISDFKRNIPLEQFLPLLDLGISFYSLQVGPASADALRLPPGSLIDCAQSLRDFSDTALLIAQLDGLITVDTSVAHLAGALGCPVWTLLHYSADWRWLRQRDDSPWYPTMRLFRQTSPGDWKPVIARVAERARQIVNSSEPSEEFKRSVKHSR